MSNIVEIILLVLGVAQIFIFAHFIMSWLISFGVLNIYQQMVGQIWNALTKLLEPIYGPIRRFMPDLGGLDLAPLVALFAIFAIETVLRGL